MSAGDSLIAHEGAFGDYLVEREPASPMLKFGREGLLDLNSPYYLKTVQGLQVIPPESWSVGFGMQCRMPIITGSCHRNFNLYPEELMKK